MRFGREHAHSRPWREAIPSLTSVTRENSSHHQSGTNLDAERWSYTLTHRGTTTFGVDPITLLLSRD